MATKVPQPPTPPSGDVPVMEKANPILGSIASFVDLTSRVSNKLRKTEVFLPIARLRAHTNSLLVGDDLSLRTSLTSPVGYDREITKILHRHHEIIGDNDNYALEYNKFCRDLSNIDKICLMWGLYKSTYGILAKDRKVRCTNPDCKHEWKVDIQLDELIHDDTFTVWDQERPFYEFVHPITVEYDDLVYEFLTRLPSIFDNNLLLSTLSTDVLQANLEKSGSVFTRPQQMAMLTKAVRLSSKTGVFEPVDTDQLEQMLISFQSYTPYAISEDFFDQYGKMFNKYVPNFYKNLKCPNCSKESKLDIDIEVEFFRRGLFGRETSE